MHFRDLLDHRFDSRAMFSNASVDSFAKFGFCLGGGCGAPGFHTFVMSLLSQSLDFHLGLSPHASDLLLAVF
jgi:hypothetical protein